MRQKRFVQWQAAILSLVGLTGMLGGSETAIAVSGGHLVHAGVSPVGLLNAVISGLMVMAALPVRTVAAQGGTRPSQAAVRRVAWWNLLTAAAAYLLGLAVLMQRIGLHPPAFGLIGTLGVAHLWELRRLQAAPDLRLARGVAERGRLLSATAALLFGGAQAVF